MRPRTAAPLLRLPPRHGPLWRRALDIVGQARLGAHDQALWTLLRRRGTAASGSAPSAHRPRSTKIGDPAVRDITLGEDGER